ncbi:MAG: hypothetical protein J3K34DRAFT_524834 [Monoraphidium minutum]|nr:MAG: hypothetical protein J3K34DRAFT_524834 [Monoraphidium minutum]
MASKAVAAPSPQPRAAPARPIAAKIGAALAKLAEGADAEWEKDEALDVIYWLRQVVGALAGLAWGYLQMPGLFGFLGFLAINVGTFMFLSKNVMGLDDDEWENASQELMSEGLPYSMSAFMVTWVLAYTTFHT